MNILYCEDDETIREILKTQLEFEFPDSFLVICTNGLEGQKQIDCMKFDLIISDFDMNLKGGDGISLFKYAKNVHKENNFNFIMLSSHPENLFKEYYINSNFYYCSKPDVIGENSIRDKLIEFKLIQNTGIKG